MPELTDAIEKELGRCAPATQVASLEEAVGRALRVAAEGDVILLSPACSSFDLFVDYEERGRLFKSLVMELT